MTLLSRVAEELERANIAYALIGAGALAVHGVSRSTHDVDLFTTDSRVLASDAWEHLAGVRVDIRRGDAVDPLAGVVRFSAAGEPDVDVIAGRAGWQRDITTRAARTRVGDREIPVAGAADLVLLKLYAGGFQDRWDIEQLLVASDRPSVVREVESRLAPLPERARELWATLKSSP